MNKKTRDWLFRIFVFLFVVITIVLSLYATGYRFNLSWPLRLDKMLVKTGTLALDTTPKNASVSITSETKISAGLSFLNSKKEQVTPIKIKNLLPGEYLVTFTLDGYWPYQKKLRVNPEQTTFLEDVILFRKSLPLNVYNTGAQEIKYSPDGKYAWLTKDQLIINLKTEQVDSNKTTSIVNWLGDDIASDGSKIISLTSDVSADYASYTGVINKSQTSGDLLIYQNEDNLSALNIKTKAATLLQFDGKVIDYQVNNNTLFVVTNNKNKIEIKSFDIKNNKNITATTLLNSKDFTFKKEKNNVILTDNEHKISYILSEDSNKVIKDVLRGATIFKWLDDNKLVYANESEIYIYDTIQTKPYLITRLSEKINSLSWGSSNFLIYSTDKTIGTVNLTSSGNDLTVLWQGDKLSSLYFDNGAGVLYFSGTIGQQGGLYKMTLK